MSTVTLSPDFQIRLPDDGREALQLAPGDEIQVIALSGRAELMPIRSELERESARDFIRAHRGFLRGKLKDTIIKDDYGDDM